MLFAPERALDLSAQLFPRTREPARDARLMLVHYPADFLKCEFLDVAELEPHPITRLEQPECGFECLSEGFDINGAVGLRRIGCRGCFILNRVAQRFHPLYGSHDVDPSLREHRAQPRLQRTAPVEVAQQRAAAMLLQAVEVGIKRIRKFTRA